MLVELHIRDFAIIEELRLELGPGFTTFTGETGAGKSIIIDAVEMLLGGRADPGMVRSGAEAALLEGTFYLDPTVRRPVQQLLEREKLLEDPEHVHLGREIRAQGRSVSRINGRTVSLALQREVGDWLVDVHGQSEHLSLLRVGQHLQLLDRFARLETPRGEYAHCFRQLGEVRGELAELRRSLQEASRRADLLSFQINEIESARLRPEEEAELQEARIRLANAERLAAGAEAALTALDQPGPMGEGALDRLGRVAQELLHLAQVDPGLQGAQQEAQALLESAGELARQLRRYLEGVEYDPRRLEEVEQRLSLLGDLKRKYGGELAAVLEHADRARRELEGISYSRDRMGEWETAEQALRIRLGELAAGLSAARAAAGRELARQVEAHLGELNMGGAAFGVEQRQQEQPEGVPLEGRTLGFDAYGVDQVEFLVETNPGEGLKPLSKIASGGETSRLMLGLKGVLAQADHTPTLIFDEIDQGIGGRVGGVVGRKLRQLSRSHQVLCITHLPQLAAHADQHFKVDKRPHGRRTVTVVTALEGEARAAELAAMLGGESAANLQSAAELLELAQADLAGTSSVSSTGVPGLVRRKTTPSPSR
jgi:DNA repair protein RecN (Recombination protein N)